MTFFYDLNKRLAQLAQKQDVRQISEDAKATAPKSQLAQALNERDMGKHNNATTGFAALAKKAGKEYGSKAAGERVAGAVKAKMAKAGQLGEVVRATDAYGDAPETQSDRDMLARNVKQARQFKGNTIGAASGNMSSNFSTGSKVTNRPAKGGIFQRSAAPAGQGKGIAEVVRTTDAFGDAPETQSDRDYLARQVKKARQVKGNTIGAASGNLPAYMAGTQGTVGSKVTNRPSKADAKFYQRSAAPAGQGKGIAEGHCSSCGCSPCECVEEGNTFTDRLRKTPPGGKFKIGNKEYTDTSNLEELDMRLLKGAQGSMKGSNTDSESERNKHKKYGYRSDRDDTGNEDDYDEHGNLKNKKKSAASDGPKKKGRPPSARSKDEERVTKGSHKYKTVDGKRVKKEKTKEGLDSDGVMMTRPSNMSSEGVSPAEQGEYNDEAGMTKDSLHTIVRNARELEKCLRQNENLPEWVQEKVGQIKGMMTSVTDYILSTHERDAEQHLGREGITIVPESADFSGSEIQQAYRLAVFLKAFIKDPDGMRAQADLVKLLRYKLQQSNDTLGPANTIEEKAVSQAQRRAAGIAHAAQKGEIPRSRLRGASKEMAKMPQGELHKFAATKEKGLPKKVKEGGKPDFIDLDKDGNKTEPMKQAAKQAKGKKEEKVDETTVAGSVATAAPSGKSSKGMQFGKGVYESYNRQFTQALNENISIESKMQECGDGDMAPAITIQADGEEAAKLMMLLKLAGLESQIPKACPTCGASPCGCDQMVDENAPDWPTNTETLAADPNLRTYSGGLNGPKSTGQSTTPVLASQLRRQASVEESVALERSLFKTWQNYKG
jgi:Protein of unknwon function (DUF3008)